MTGSVRGPLLVPREDRSVDWLPDGEIRWDQHGAITFVGPAADDSSAPRSRGVILPPFLDCHTHIPQWPVRGRFCDGIDGHPPEGRLLAGLNRNVFPAEGRCGEAEHVRATVDAFAADTLAHGVVGGAAYMTVHAAATAAALATLSPLWHVGLVLMNMNCPPYLRTDEPNLERDVERLVEQFPRRVIVTDRFAVAVDSPLRRRAVALAERLGLRMQTHLNEQPREKHFVEDVLYPASASYTDVYRADGLLREGAILAHCVHMGDAEFDAVVAAGSVVAHCPTSNALLGSGIMSLDRVVERRIPYAICTDVGASPTTSILSEMATFVNVHAGRSARATPSEALYRTTLGAAKLMKMDEHVGRLALGRPASFIEVDGAAIAGDADAVIARVLLGLDERPAARQVYDPLLPGGLEDPSALSVISEDVERTARALDEKVVRVTLGGRTVWDRRVTPAR